MDDFPVTDIFETNGLEFPEGVGVAPLPSKIKETEEPVNEKFENAVAKQVQQRNSLNSITLAPVPKKSDPAFNIVSKGNLSEDEYKIFHAAIEEFDQLIKVSSGDMEASLRKSKLRLLDILAMKFGFPNASTMNKDGLSFNLKRNYEVELIKRRVLRSGA